MSDDTLDPLLEPIPGDDPGGANLRYQPVYDDIKKARHEDPVLPQGEWKRERKVADWDEVVSLATEALSERTKDLQLAAWLTEGWVREDGFPGLDRGLRLLIRLQEEFWDHLYPRIEEEDDLEFRAVPLEWIGEYLEPSLNSVPLNADGHSVQDYNEARRIGTEEEAENDASKRAARKEAIEAERPLLEDFQESFVRTPKPFYKELAASLESSRETLKELDELGDELYGPVAPSFLTLRKQLEEIQRLADRLLRDKLEMDPDPPEVEAAGSGGEDGADGASGSGDGGQAGSSTGAGAGGGASAAPRTIDSADAATSAIAKAAAFLRKEDPTSPAPYLLLRGLRWGELRTAGEIDPRILAAPPTNIRTRLKGLLLDREWSTLLEQGEEVMATPYGRGWLDLQRYVVTALGNLGSDYDPVVDAVSQAIRGLLQVRPELTELTLMDDSPTANRETMEWLESEVLGEGGGGDGAEPRASRPRRPRGDPHQRAMDRLRAGDPQRAIELLMDAASREDSARERFLRRSEATRIMVSEGMEGVALPILQEMMDQIERHSLEEWEAGDTVARPMSLLYTSMERTGGDANLQEELYLRVCRLDPMQGMRLKGGGGDNGGASAPESESDPQPAPAEGGDGG